MMPIVPKRAFLTQMPLGSFPNASIQSLTNRRPLSNEIGPKRLTPFYKDDVGKYNIFSKSKSGLLPVGMSQSLPTNCWLAPGFNAAQIRKTLQEQLNGRHSLIDPTGLYIDPQSAADWCYIAHNTEYRTLSENIPFGEIIDTIDHVLSYSQPAEELDVIFLGPGDAYEELLFAQQLVAHLPQRIRFLFLDVNQSLLTTAFRNAQVSLPNHANVEIVGVLGDMYQLREYLPLFSTPHPLKRRLVVLQGRTFSNLINEPLFVRDSLFPFDPGDLFLFDTLKIKAGIDKPSEIRRKEPRLSGHKPPRWDYAIERFFDSLIKRHCAGVKNIAFTHELDMDSCMVPESYSIEMSASITFTHSTDHHIAIQRFKRHSPRGTARYLQREGWHPLNGWNYGMGNDMAMYLYQKK